MSFPQNQPKEVIPMSELWPLEDEHWIFPARLERVVDGDTFDFALDLGFRTYKQVRVRLYGVDTNEIYGTEEESDEYQRGLNQKLWVEGWFDRVSNIEEWPLLVSTADDTGPYARWPGLVRDRNGNSLREHLIDAYPDVEG